MLLSEHSLAFYKCNDLIINYYKVKYSSILIDDYQYDDDDVIPLKMVKYLHKLYNGCFNLIWSIITNV